MQNISIYNKKCADLFYKQLFRDQPITEFEFHHIQSPDQLIYNQGMSRICFSYDKLSAQGVYPDSINYMCTCTEGDLVFSTKGLPG